jgi:hypothetical protein
VTTTETQLAYIPDHGDRAVGKVLSQFKRKPRIAALIRALASGTQELEDELFSLIVSRTLTAATGAELDQWGSVVGEPRGSLGDSDYRRFIRARTMVNVCKGDVDSLIAIWQVVMGTEDVRFLPTYPAGYRLQAVRSALLPEYVRRRARRIMVDPKPGGVTSVCVEARRGFFGFSGNPDALGFDVGRYARIL